MIWELRKDEEWRRIGRGCRLCSCTIPIKNKMTKIPRPCFYRTGTHCHLPRDSSSRWKATAGRLLTSSHPCTFHSRRDECPLLSPSPRGNQLTGTTLCQGTTLIGTFLSGGSSQLITQEGGGEVAVHNYFRQRKTSEIRCDFRLWKRDGTTPRLCTAGPSSACGGTPYSLKLPVQNRKLLHLRMHSCVTQHATTVAEASPSPTQILGLWRKYAPPPTRTHLSPDGGIFSNLLEEFEKCLFFPPFHKFSQFFP